MTLLPALLLLLPSAQCPMTPSAYGTQPLVLPCGSAVLACSGPGAFYDYWTQIWTVPDGVCSNDRIMRGGFDK